MSGRWFVDWDGFGWRVTYSACEGYSRCTCKYFSTWQEAFEYADRMARR